MGGLHRNAPWPATAALFAAVVALVWVWPELPVGNAGELLSTLAQALAAVLAIVFALGLLAIEAGSEYAHRISLVTRRLLAFALVTIAATLLSVWLLGEDTRSDDSVRVAYTLAAGSLLLLVPFITGIARDLAPDRVIDRLSDEADDADDESHKAVVTLENLTMSAAARRDYETFGNGLKALAALRPRQDLDPVGRFEEIGHGFVTDPAAMRVLAEVSIELAGRSDAERRERLLRALAGVAEAASRHGFELSARPLIGTLGAVALAASTRAADGGPDFEDLTRLTTTILQELGERLARDEHRASAQLVVAQLSLVADKHAGRDGGQLAALRAVEALRRVGEAAARAPMPGVTLTAIDGLGGAGRAATAVLADSLVAARAVEAIAVLGRAGGEPSALAAADALRDVGVEAARHDAVELPRMCGEALRKLWDSCDTSQMIGAVALAAGAIGREVAGALARPIYVGLGGPIVEELARFVGAVGKEEVGAQRAAQPIAAEVLMAIALAALRADGEAAARVAIGELAVLAEAAVRIPPAGPPEYDYMLRYPIRYLGQVGAGARDAGAGDAAELAVRSLAGVAVAMQRASRLETIGDVADALREVGGEDASALAAELDGLAG
ncbi:MAG TPA: hypothetical protein VF529_01420 [Solirubrobacteraceae bacterium]|jgi:hypothetical protein